MRRRELLRPSSRDVCIFCACRLVGQSSSTASRASFATHRRAQASTSVRRQQAGSPAVAESPYVTNNPNVSHQGHEIDGSTLSKSELREIEYLKEQARQLAQTPLVRGMRPDDRTAAATQHGPSSRFKMIKLPYSKDQPVANPGRAKVKQHLSSPSGQAATKARHGEIAAEVEAQASRSIKEAREVAGHNQKHKKKVIIDGQHQAASIVQKPQRDKQRKEATVKKMPMPAFLSAAPKQDTSQSSAPIWGAGDLQVGSVQYGERDSDLVPPKRVEDDGGFRARRGSRSLDLSPLDVSESDVQAKAKQVPETASHETIGSRSDIKANDHDASSFHHTNVRASPGHAPASAPHYHLQPTPPGISLNAVIKTGYRAKIVDGQESRSNSASSSRPRDKWLHFPPPEEPVVAPRTEPVSEMDQQQIPDRSIDIDKMFERHRVSRGAGSVIRPWLTGTPENSRAERSGRRNPSAEFTSHRALRREIGHVDNNYPLDPDIKAQHELWSANTAVRSVFRKTESTDEHGGPRQTTTTGHDELTTPGQQYRRSSQDRDPAQMTSLYTPARASASKHDFEPGYYAQDQLSSKLRNDSKVEDNGEKRVSSFEDSTQRILSSRRFSDAPARKQRAARRSRDNDDDDEYYGRDEEDDIDYEEWSARDARKAEKQAKKDEARRAREAATRNREDAKAITLPDYISVSNLSQALGVRYENFIVKLERLGYDDVFPGKILNAETSALIAMEYGFDPLLANEAEKDASQDLHAQPAPEGADLEYLPARPPVVTIMGHVDHGKTTILDYLRHASVAAGEAGGITQHIGAFSVALEATGRTITFLDTPGHAAFLAMRQRGANVTDIVVLVVAADDSVKPQTLEALKHARAANVPIIVAINKVDKPEANVQQVKSDLGRHGIEIEDYGGDTQVVEVSGKSGQGMADLEEAIVTQSELLDHRADTEGVVEGWVLEATTKPAGRVATVLVRRGTLRVGSILVAGKTWARVRSLRNDNGKEIHEAPPGTPVEVDGWRDQPSAGDEVLQAESEQRATSVVEYRRDIEERKKLAQDTEAINDARMLEQIKRDAGEDTSADTSNDASSRDAQSTGPVKVPFIIKADVSGSAEAIEAYIMSVSSPMITPQILHSAVGQINENDVELASVAQGVIIAFNLPSDQGMKASAMARNVHVMEHNIIYRVLDEVKELFAERLPRIISQKVLGEAEVSAFFDISVGGRAKLKIAGCKIRNGVIGKTSRVRVMRDAAKVYDGTISSLKNVKKDVQEMRKGNECGMAFENWEDFKIGDLVQTYEEISEKRSL